MSESTPVSKDSPLWRAWAEYKISEEYANARNWAGHDEHVDGSMWDAFEHGFAAATPTPARSEAAPTHAEIIDALGPMIDGGSTPIEQVEQATREHDAARSEAAGGEGLTEERIRHAIMYDPMAHAAYTLGTTKGRESADRELTSLRQQLAAAREDGERPGIAYEKGWGDGYKAGKWAVSEHPPARAEAGSEGAPRAER